MTTVNDVFSLTMSLIDELSERTGAPDPAQTRDYMQRTPGIVTVLLGELYRYSDTYRRGEPGVSPACPPVTSIDDVIGLDDTLCRGALPYGIAARLLTGENSAAAAYYEREYQRVKQELRLPVSAQPIADVYGGLITPGESGAER